MRRIHIVGAHRSGTSLMLDLVATCFRVSGSCPDEMSIYLEPDRPHDLFVSKQPRDVRIIGRVMAHDPDLWVIGMVRDPRAVITSINRSHPDMYFCNMRVWHECDRAARALADHPRFVQVKYEDLVSDPDAVQQRLMERMPFLERLHPFSEFDKHSRASEDARRAMSGVRAINKDRIEGWKEHLPRIQHQIREHGGLIEALINHGYEPDDKWTRMLEGVAPVETPCRTREHDNLWHKIDWMCRDWVKYRRKLRNLRQRAAGTSRMNP